MCCFPVALIGVEEEHSAYVFNDYASEDLYCNICLQSALKASLFWRRKKKDRLIVTTGTTECSQHCRRWTTNQTQAAMARGMGKGSHTLFNISTSADDVNEGRTKYRRTVQIWSMFLLSFYTSFLTRVCSWVFYPLCISDTSFPPWKARSLLKKRAHRLPAGRLPIFLKGHPYSVVVYMNHMWASWLKDIEGDQRPSSLSLWGWNSIGITLASTMARSKKIIVRIIVLRESFSSETWCNMNIIL